MPSNIEHSNIDVDKRRMMGNVGRKFRSNCNWTLLFAHFISFRRFFPFFSFQLQSHGMSNNKQDSRWQSQDVHSKESIIQGNCTTTLTVKVLWSRRLYLFLMKTRQVKEKIFESLEWKNESPIFLGCQCHSQLSELAHEQMGGLSDSEIWKRSFKIHIFFFSSLQWCNQRLYLKYIWIWWRKKSTFFHILSAASHAAYPKERKFFRIWISNWKFVCWVFSKLYLLEMKLI